MLVSLFVSYFKTYRGITHLPLTSGDYFTALIGENGAGKSSALEAIDCLLADGEWNINSSSRKNSRSIPSVACVFKIIRSEVSERNNNLTRVYKIVDSVIRGFNSDSITPKLKNVAEKFISLRDDVLLKSDKDDFFFSLTGKLYETDDVFLSIFYDDIVVNLKEEFKSEVQDDEFFLKNILKDYSIDIIDRYTYIYIPAEIKTSTFTKLQNKKIQQLMGKSIDEIIEETITKKDVSEINNGLNKYLSKIEETLETYKYKRLPKKDGYLTFDDVKAKIIEAFFETRALNKKTDTGDINIQDLSSGEKKTAIIDLSLAFIRKNQDKRKYILIAFDEPEASLHLSACFDQYQKIYNISEENVQVFIATHWYGFMPIVSSGSAIHITKNDSRSITQVPLFNYKENMHHRAKELSSTLSDIDLKSMNDLVQSIFHSIKSENPINWIICEGSTDKIYIDHYLGKRQNLKVIPLGGVKMVKRLFEYLSAPVEEISRAANNIGKVLFIVDTDEEVVEFSRDNISDVVSAKRLLIVGDDVKLVRVNDKRVVRTVIEDCLNSDNYIIALKKLAEKHPELFNIINNSQENSGAKCSAEAYDLKRSEVERIKEFFKEDGIKMELCREYTSLSNKGRPAWIMTVEEFFGFRKLIVKPEPTDNDSVNTKPVREVLSRNKNSLKRPLMPAKPNRKPVVV